MFNFRKRGDDINRIKIVSIDTTSLLLTVELPNGEQHTVPLFVGDVIRIERGLHKKGKKFILKDAPGLYLAPRAAPTENGRYWVLEE